MALGIKRLAQKLGNHMTQKRWLDASDASVEKCVMLGFYSVRKMLEAFQPPPNMDFQSKVTTFPSTTKKISPICYPEVLEALDLKKPKNETVALKDLCNQVIHSYFFQYMDRY